MPLRLNLVAQEPWPVLALGRATADDGCAPGLVDSVEAKEPEECVLDTEGR